MEEIKITDDSKFSRTISRESEEWKLVHDGEGNVIGRSKTTTKFYKVKK